MRGRERGGGGRRAVGGGGVWSVGHKASGSYGSVHSKRQMERVRRGSHALTAGREDEN